MAQINVVMFSGTVMDEPTFVHGDNGNLDAALFLLRIADHPEPRPFTLGTMPCRVEGPHVAEIALLHAGDAVIVRGSLAATYVEDDEGADPSHTALYVCVDALTHVSDLLPGADHDGDI